MIKESTSCGVIIFSNDDQETKFLLVKELRGQNFSFSKGHTEKGESHLQTALREVFEEVNLTPAIVDGYMYINTYSFRLDENTLIKKTVHYFLGIANSMVVQKQLQEIDEILWLNYNDAYEKLTYLNDKINLEKAYNDLKDLKLVK